MRIAELYGRCMELAAAEPSAQALRYLHETLTLTCGMALKGSGQAFGNVFSLVDYLCKQHGIAMRDRIAIQTMRRHSNGHEHGSREDWLYDVRALCHFISAVSGIPIPQELLACIPATLPPVTTSTQTNLRYIRCVVTGWDTNHIYATTANGAVCILLTDAYLTDMLKVGMQLNLLDSRSDDTVITPGLIVIEPDYLVDISSLAACFQDYGHHPFNYLLNRMRPFSNAQQVLLGNFAGEALDDLIHQTDYQLNDTLRSTFRRQALQFCTCEHFDSSQFKTDAATQVANIREAVEVLFDTDTAYQRTNALLEPSFVCEQLGLQGRVDLMTTDMCLLVEQKSGKNWNIECPQPGQKGLQKEDHYVQLLLYYGVLRYNFHLSTDHVDIRLLYSKYPARKGLVVVNFYQQLFREAIKLRNRIVVQEMDIAQKGFGSVMPQLRSSLLLEKKEKTDFFNRYIRPQADRIFMPLHQLSATERDYVERMLTFVYREQLARKVGVQEGQGSAVADLWNVPLTEKQDTGSMLTGPIVRKEGDMVTLAIDTSTMLPNFRRGDMVYLYRFEGEPDVRANILYKGVMARLTGHEAVVRLNDGQQHATVFTAGTYAIEHAASDIISTAAIRSIHAFATALQSRRDLLLGLRNPRRDDSRQLSRSYHPHYDDILLQARQALDYFLLQGPPGTGKTSMALRFIVEEELAVPSSSLLLMAYTNRAVDEICDMLEDAGIDYLRLGSETSCDPRFTARLLDHVLGASPKLTTIRQQLMAMRIIVGTTSMLQSHPFIFLLKHFSLAVVDEASQILEPDIIGLLSSEHIDRFILIGDHKQLPAVVQQPDDEPRLHNCRLSLFERLLQQERDAGRKMFTGLLRRQGRMHPDIARFPNDMFYRREQLQPVPCPHQREHQLDYQEPSEDHLDDLLKQHRVLFLPSEPCRSMMTSDKVNISEARIVADLLRRIYRQYGSRFDADHTVGVIVPYRNQIAMIRHEIEILGIEALCQISIDTVERYQGSQRDVIIYSFTIQQPYQLDFLTFNSFEEDGYVIDRKLNVAMTRARKQLLMTGNIPVLQQNDIFRQLISRYAIPSK